MYRGRLAPSPTGLLHLGHARTYLVAWLRARAAKGALVLRMEDLDPPRVVPGAAAAILEDLAFLGLDWDEGPDRGGPHAPYVQSERAAVYEDALRSLAPHVYPCTCSRKEITQSAPHGAPELGPRYPGTCRNGPTHPARPAALRFRMPAPEAFVDALHGPVDKPEAGGDFVLKRADGLYAYQLAVVVDDRAMGITEVVRGDDLLASTPRQIALHRALGAEPPQFLHVPLVLGESGERLSKRDGAIAIRDLRAEGAPRILSALAASLGIDARDVTSPSALLSRFDVAKIPARAVSRLL